MQVYIYEEQIKQLKFEARKENLDVSKLIREAIDGFLKRKHENINWDKDPLTQAVGQIELSVDNASVIHDNYLYDKKRKNNLEKGFVHTIGWVALVNNYVNHKKAITIFNFRAQYGNN